MAHFIYTNLGHYSFVSIFLIITVINILKIKILTIYTLIILPVYEYLIPNIEGLKYQRYIFQNFNR